VLLLAGVLVWNAWQVLGAGAGPSSGGLGGALLGPEKSGGLTGWWVFAGFLVVVWLLDSGREHLCSCFAQGISAFPFGVGWVSCFCCVCVCGDKL
jgi:hypothetical protein